MRRLAGTNLQPPDAQCNISISTILIQNYFKLPSSLKSNVDAKCRFNKCRDNKNVFNGVTMYFFLAFLVEKFPFLRTCVLYKKCTIYLLQIFIKTWNLSLSFVALENTSD